MDLDLRGRIAVVTGGSRGLGKAIARELAREGADVALVARTRDATEAAAREIAAETGRSIIASPADTDDDASVRRMAADVARRLGPVSILINNAAKPGGQSAVPDVLSETKDRLDAHMNTKVMGYWRCAQAVAPSMIEQGWGRIVNISGLGARRSGDAVGSIRNAAVVALSKNLADALGPKGINVNVVHPGQPLTEGVQAMIAARASAEGVTESEMAARMASNLIGRLNTMAEFAYVVTFLASPKAVALSGEVIVAAGGVKQIITY